jgi:O-antigen ligase
VTLRSFFFLISFLAVSLLAGLMIAQYSPGRILAGVLVLVIFTISLINIEWGLYVLIFSMLLSPELVVGSTGGGSIGRGVTLRLEDFLLMVIGISWFARNAVNKDLGLFLKTPLNKPILFYVLACVVSTGWGIMCQRVGIKTGALFVLKYVEYFIVFFMMVNHVRSTGQIRRFVFCLFLTCLIVSVIGMLQIPSGARVSAPFEGKIGEPNTFGGYLVFVGALAAGLLARAQKTRTKHLLIVLIVTILPPFLFTQSRSSYLAAIPACLVLGFMADRRIIILGLVAISFVLSPFLLPSVVKERIMFTFKQPEEPGQITIGDIHLDTSTSARLASWRQAFEDWPKHPILGYGITGYQFVDAQFPRVLVETGVLGLTTFLYLLYSILKLTLLSLKRIRASESQGLCIGFLAGFVGLLVHAIGANTFIIVRIMEPFWFLVGIVAVLPMLEESGESSSAPLPKPSHGWLPTYKT